MTMRLFKHLSIAGIGLIFSLSLADAWKNTYVLGSSVLTALVPTLIVSASFVAAAVLGRRTGRQFLLRVAASSICLLGLVAYAGYAFAGPANSDTASQMHIFFFPAVFGLLAFAVMGVCVLVAYVRLPKIQ
jgi:hypothetical protein